MFNLVNVYNEIAYKIRFVKYLKLVGLFSTCWSAMIFFYPHYVKQCLIHSSLYNKLVHNVKVTKLWQSNNQLWLIECRTALTSISPRSVPLFVSNTSSWHSAWWYFTLWRPDCVHFEFVNSFIIQIGVHLFLNGDCIWSDQNVKCYYTYAFVPMTFSSERNKKCILPSLLVYIPIILQCNFPNHIHRIF